MAVANKIALFFVVLYSVFIILHTYAGDQERMVSNISILLLNGFAYFVSAMELEKEGVEA